MVAVVAFAAPALAATNPFMDVPQGHWSYDAVGLLASRGIVSGYPDGAFKGAQPATRYEMASVVARALVTVDAEKASKQDLELLKKLVMEFKDELDALGVKVDSLDKRVAVLEDGIGGWKVRGTFWFDANFAGGDHDTYGNAGVSDTDFNKQRFRLFLTKQIDENSLFYAELRAGENENKGWGRGDMFNARIRDMYVDTMLPWEIGFRAGRFLMDFEADHGFYIDNDATYGDYRVDGFQFTKTWNTFAVKAIVGRNAGFYEEANPGEFMNYALDITWQPTENFFLGANGVWIVTDGDKVDNADVNTYSVYASYNFTPAIALKGMYYFQDLDNVANAANMIDASHVDTLASEDSPQAWKAILDIDQDALKFTSLRVEYQEQDNTFAGMRDPYSFAEANAGSHTATIAKNMPWNDGTTKFLFVKAEQQWTEKWSTYLRYGHADFDTNEIDDADNYGIGVTYQYTPAIAFRLAYDYVDYGDCAAGYYSGDDHVFQFRTVVNF